MNATALAPQRAAHDAPDQRGARREGDEPAQRRTRVLDLRGLGVDLSGRCILSDVDLGVDEASLVGLVGPNGAGKTTLLRAIMGLIPASHGSIERDGLPGYVPQRHDIAWSYPISVEQTVMTSLHIGMSPWRRTTAEHWHKVYDALSMVSMMDLRQRTLDELSGGQKQRVLIARALARSPRLLLLDEPFTGLDHPTQDELTALFRELTGRGVAIIMSTHDLSQAVDVCHRLVLLNGRVIAEGAPADLKDPRIWMDAFEVGPASALLRTIGLGGDEGGRNGDDDREDVSRTSTGIGGERGGRA